MQHILIVEDQRFICEKIKIESSNKNTICNATGAVTVYPYLILTVKLKFDSQAKYQAFLGLNHSKIRLEGITLPVRYSLLFDSNYTEEGNIIIATYHIKK